jgi:hypothetical protein
LLGSRVLWQFRSSLGKNFVNGLEHLTLSDESSNDVALRDLWAERPAALIFLRHYG